MNFAGYEEVPVYDNDGLIDYYQLRIAWEEND